MKTSEIQLKEFYVKFFVDENGKRQFLGLNNGTLFTEDILDSDVLHFSKSNKDENWDDEAGTELQTLPVKIRYEIEIG